MWNTADWDAVLENTITGAGFGFMTGFTFGAATVGEAAVGAAIFGSRTYYVGVLRGHPP
jgi:hypothetical protein